MKLTQEEFHATKEYLACTIKQRTWLDTFLVTGDPIAATRAACPTASELSLKVLVTTIQGNMHVRQALQVAEGLTELEAFIQETKRTMDRSRIGSESHIRAMALYARLKFGTADLPHRMSAADAMARVTAAEPSKPETFAVGDIVTQDGAEYRVASVDAQGQILTVDDIE